MTRATVLVVDDEAPLLRAMTRLLAKSFEVLTAPNGAAALAMFGEGVSLVLTDFSMPDVNGLQLAKQLRGRGFKGPIAMLSAVVEDGEVQAALAAGDVNELISKPWSSANLLSRVTALCLTAAPIPV